MRGNRTVKVSSDNLAAFSCPNMQPLAIMGINIEVDYKSINRPTAIGKYNILCTISSSMTCCNSHRYVILTHAIEYILHSLNSKQLLK